MKKVLNVFYVFISVMFVISLFVDKDEETGSESQASTKINTSSEFNLLDNKNLIFNRSMSDLASKNLKFVAGQGKGKMSIELKNGYLITELLISGNGYSKMQGQIKSYSSPSEKCIGFSDFDATAAVLLGRSYNKDRKPMAQKMLCKSLEDKIVKTMSYTSNNASSMSLKIGELVYYEYTSHMGHVAHYRRVRLSK